MTSKNKILIIPGLNQSRNLYTPLLSSQVDIIEFSSNLSDSSLFYNDSLLNYKIRLHECIERDNYTHIFAHSLGCVLALHCFQKDIIYHLFAPAFSGHTLLNLITKLPAGWKIPSLAYPRFRTHPFCTVGHYRDILELNKSLDHKSFWNKENIEIFFDPRDELVDKTDLCNFKYCNEVYSSDFPKHYMFDQFEKEITKILNN